MANKVGGTKNHGYRRVTLNVQTYQPNLTHDGGLELTVPMHEGPMFTPEYRQYLEEQHGGRDADIMLDIAAEDLLKQDLAKMLVR